MSQNRSRHFFVRDKKTGRLHAQCKQCYQKHRSTYYAAHYQKYRPAYLERAKIRRTELRSIFRSKMLAYLSDKSCMMCGENDIRVLEFDHLDPSQKSFEISQGIRLGHSWNDILQEIEKCRILCANCHKKHTSSQFNWYKSL
jgi:hypothetical protein